MVCGIKKEKEKENNKEGWVEKESFVFKFSSQDILQSSFLMQPMDVSFYMFDLLGNICR